MDDDTDAAWDQQQQDERHRCEDELIERCRPLQAELRQMIKDIELSEL